MELEEAKERLKRFDGKCDKCQFSACEQCEINYSDVQAINMVLAELDKRYDKGYQDGYKQAKYEVEIDKLNI